MNVTTVDPAPDAPASRRSRRSVNAIPCFEYFVHRSGIIDASTLRGQTSGMVETIANRAWVALSPQQQLDMIVQAREEELRQPATSPPDSDHDVPIVPSPIQIATSNSSSDSVSPEPMMEDNAGITARPGDSNIDASGDSEPIVAAVIDGTFENGCEVIKLPLVRAQAPKIAERAQYEAVAQPDGSIRYPKTNPDGTPKDPIREKGDVYLVDCCVTGSNEGTKKDPKCSLLLVFKELIFPAIQNLVGPGKEYEDCHVIIQGDQAGPHEDGTFSQFVNNYCAEQGWTWQPQAPQMPHANVLDLSVFPAMSKRHSEWARKLVGTSVISTDQIWDMANEVYNAMPNSKIASAFIQYWRIMSHVIKAGGSNEFVGRMGKDKTLHTGIRNDFDETAKGMKPSARHPSNN